MSTLNTQDNNWLYEQTISSAGTITNTLETLRKYLDRNIEISITTPAAELQSGGSHISSLNYAYNSSTGKFNVTGSGTVQAPIVVTPGFINEGDTGLSSNTADVSATVNKIGLTHTATGQTSAVTPTITRIGIGGGNLVDAADSMGTTTAPSSGVYVAVQSLANTGTLAITPKVSSAGYGTTTNGQYTTSTQNYTVGANDSAVTYIPIITTTRTAGDGVLNLTAGNGTATCTIGTGDSASTSNPSLTLATTAPTSGVYYSLTITGKGSVSGSGSGKVSTGSGWVTEGETTSNAATGTKESKTQTIYRYLTKSVTGSTVSDALPTSISGRVSNTFEDIEIQPKGYVKLPAGYYPKDRYVFANVADASGESRPASNFSLTVSDISGVSGDSNVTVGELSDGYYPLTANNLSVSATLQAQEAGWFSTGEATDTDVDGVTVGKMAAAVIASDTTGTTASVSVTPSAVSIANKTASVSGKTQIAVSPTTATSGISKYYIAVNGTSKETTTTNTVGVDISTKVTTGGYIPQDTTGSTTGTTAISTTTKANAKTGSTYYIPLATATFKQEGDSFKSNGAGWVPANTTLLTLTTVQPVPSVTNSGLSTYFDTTTDTTNANVTLTPTYSTSAGYVVAQDSYLGTPAYYNIKIGQGAANTANVTRFDTDGSSNGTNVYGIVGTAQTTEPTSGYYLAFTGSGSSKVSTAGWFAKDAVLPTASQTKYFPLTQATCTLGGGVLSKTDYSKTNLSLSLTSGSDTNMGTSASLVSSKNNTTYPYYFKVNGATDAINDTTSVSVSAITKAHSAGFMPAQSTTNWKDAQNASVGISVNAASNSTYIGIKAATISVGGTATDGSYSNNISISSGYADYGIGTTQPSGSYITFTPTTTITAPSFTPTATVSQSGYATGDIPNGSVVSSSLTQSNTTPYYAKIVTPAFTIPDISKNTDTLNITTAPTATIAASGQFFNSTNMTKYGITTTKPTGTDGTNYLMVDGTLSTSAGSATSAWDVEHQSAVYSAKYQGLINIASGTAISSTVKTQSGGVSNKTITVSTTDNFAPHYIPIVTPAFTGGVISISNGSITNSSTDVAFGTGTSDGYLVNLGTTGSASHSDIKYAGTYKGAISVTASSTLSGITTTATDINFTKKIYIKKATPAFTGGAITPTATMSGGADSNIVLSDTNNGVAITAYPTATRTAVTYSSAVNGYVKVSSGAVASAAITTPVSGTAVTRYLSSVRIPPAASASTPNVFSVSVPNGSTDEYITFTFSVDNQGNTLIDGDIVYDGTYN